MLTEFKKKINPFNWFDKPPQTHLSTVFLAFQQPFST